MKATATRSRATIRDGHHLSHLSQLVDCGGRTSCTAMHNTALHSPVLHVANCKVALPVCRQQPCVCSPAAHHRLAWTVPWTWPPLGRPTTLAKRNRSSPPQQPVILPPRKPTRTASTAVQSVAQCVGAIVPPYCSVTRFVSATVATCLAWLVQGEMAELQLRLEGAVSRKACVEVEAGTLRKQLGTVLGKSEVDSRLIQRLKQELAACRKEAKGSR